MGDFFSASTSVSVNWAWKVITLSLLNEFKNQFKEHGMTKCYSRVKQEEVSFKHF